MASKKTDIIVYAHWQGMPDPLRMGVLSSQEARGHLAWSFAYDKVWLESQSQLQLDPDLQWFTGPQYSPDKKPNFGMFLDSMPDVRELQVGADLIESDEDSEEVRKRLASLACL